MASEPLKPLVSIGQVWALVAMVGFGVTASVIVSILRPNTDNAVLIATILGFVGTSTVSLLALLKNQDTYHVVNSRMDEFKAALEEQQHVAVSLARAQGLADGNVQGAQAANLRTDDIKKPLSS